MFLNKFSDLLHTSYLQFGYKADASTNIAALCVKDVINHHTKGKSPVFACFLDASKAFDRVCFSDLARVLLDRLIPPSFVSLLITMYRNQVAHVNWNNFASNEFEVTCGVAVYSTVRNNRDSNHVQ